MNKLPYYFSALIFLIACKTPPKEKFDLLITNATVIDIAGGLVLPGKLIGINGDTIRMVSDMESVNSFESEQLIDAEEQYVMPGLWDNHVHFRGGDSLIQENKDLLPLYLAFGVTTVRDSGGDITPSVLQWRKEIREGKLVGPNIFTSGPKLDGEESFWAGSIPISKKEEIPAALDSLEKLEVDFVKTYDSPLSPELYYEIIKQAEQRGLKVTGHVPLSANHFEALEYGLDGAEHLFSFLSLGSPVGDSLRELNNRFNMFPEVTSTFDEDIMNEAIIKMGFKEFYVMPTLYVSQVLLELHEKDTSTDNILPLIGPGIQKTYERRINQAKNRSQEGRQLMVKMDILERSLIVPMHHSGITILAGSDCGPSNSYVYPGTALHSELALLVEVGLSPREALAASVINGPKFFDLDKYYGSVEAGKVAHLIFLDKNPLENIENTRSVSRVVKGINSYDHTELQDWRSPFK